MPASFHRQTLLYISETTQTLLRSCVLSRRRALWADPQAQKNERRNVQRVSLRAKFYAAQILIAI